MITKCIEFHNRTMNILSFQHNDGTSVSVGGKGKIVIPLDQAGHASIIHSVRIGDLWRGRVLWLDETGKEVMEEVEMPSEPVQAPLQDEEEIG